FSSRRRHTRFSRDWSSDVCSSDLPDLTACPPYGRPRSAAPGTRERVPRGYPVPPEEAVRTGGVTGSGAPVGWDGHVTHYGRPHRSEERRVGKECRQREPPEHEK